MYRSFNDSEDSDNEYGNSSDSEVDSDESRQVIERGPLSTVRRVRRKCSSDDPPWIAVKTSFTSRTSSKQPHDVIKEVRLLSKLSHVNVVELLDYTYDQSSRAMHLWMPYIPIPFHKVLNSPLFSPFPFPFVPALPNAVPTKEVEALSSRFLVISKSLTFQIISAIAYLHSPPNNIAHRDIKPRNLLLTEEGYIKLIDFGISWKEDESEQDQKDDLWPERKENMCAAVSTGPYRAPELLFTPKSYNAFSADLWSLGATLAELFTPLSLQASSSSYSDDEDADSPVLEDDTPPHFILSPNINMEYPDPDLDHDWVRTSLFDGSRGELGLIWSIFKTMGTPNESSWPGYKDLVSSMNITFIEVPGVPLESRLPNLPPPMMTTPRTVTTAPRTNGFDLVSALLVYPPEDRLKANDALSHPWLTSDDVPLLLASGYSLRAEQEHVKSQVVFDWKTRSLGDLTKEVLMWNGQSQDHDTRETGRKWK